MAATRLSWLALLAVATLGLLELLPPAGADYPGVIELVGYSNRRARTHYMPPSYASHGRQLDTPTLAPPPAKTQADIETVKQNIEKYNKLLTLDTRHLPDSQKDMLERIVERVARLKESLDVEHNARQLNQSRTDATTTPTTDATTSAMTDPDADIEAETDPTLVLDETTLLQLQTSMDELAAAQAAVTAQTTRMRELPTTTEFTTADAQEADAGATAATGSPDTTASGSGTGSSSQEFEATTDTPLTDATDADDQFVAARSNNRNIAAITAAEPLATSVASGASASSTPHSTTAGNQRTLTTSGKAAKTRPTKRPGSTSPSTSSSTKAAGSTTSKRVGGQRPGSTASLHKPTTSKQKLAAAAAAALTTAQPHSTHHHSNANTNSYGHSSHKTKTHPKVTEKTPAAPATIASSTASSYAGVGVGVGGEMAYDSHVNTSAIIDSLNHAREEFYHQKQTVNNNNGPISSTNNKDKKPSATAKPTKYHYYPHNQHIYLLPECAIQQVCNAVYVRLNYTQPLCACPSRYRDPCSASLNEDDQHTTKLVGDGKKKAITLAKTCEATTEMRECRSPKDWSLLALQNTRTGKSHYLVICRCPDHFRMEGPMAHDQPTYASVPGIRVFGMMCVKPGYSARKPSVQPPKRYQLQKPFYRPGSQSSSYGGGSQYGGNKDAYGRPIYGGSPSSSSSMSSLPSSSNSGYHQSSDSFQSQHQANYQYLNRPESSHISSSHKNHNSNNNYHPESISIGNFNGGGIYGRNNERKGDAPIQAATNEPEDEDQKTMVMMTSTSTPAVATEVEARTTHSEEPSAGDNNSSTNTSNNNNSMETTAAEASQAPPSSSSSSTPSTTEGKREKRSVVEEISELEDDGQMPEFPWDRVIEFQQSIVWD